MEEPVVPRRTPLRAAIKTGRPQEWIKNVFVFAGCSSRASSTSRTRCCRRSLTFVAFCGISSAGYYVNDLVDVELDRKHPKKRFRPLAAGELSERAAMTIAPMLAAAAIGLSFATVNWEVGLMVIGYGIAQMAYSLGLKQIVIVDVMTLAGLFILRVAAGASAVDAHASEWLLLCTGMIALFLGFTKRRQEAVSELHEGHQQPARAGALLAALPRPDGRPGHDRDRDQLLDLRGRLADRRQRDDVDDPAGRSTCIFRYLYLIYDRADDRSIAAMVAEDKGMIAGAAAFVGRRLRPALRLQLISGVGSSRLGYVEAGATELLLVDVDDGGVRTGGRERRRSADRHHEALLLPGGHPGRTACLELRLEALGQLGPVGVVDVEAKAVPQVRLVPADVDAERDLEAPVMW